MEGDELMVEEEDDRLVDVEEELVVELAEDDLRWRSFLNMTTRFDVKG